MLETSEASKTIAVARRDTFLAVVICLAATLLLLLGTELLTLTNPDYWKPADHHKYIWMTAHPFDLYIAPFCWRIGWPLLVSILPLDISVAFLLLTFLSIAATGFVLWLIIQRLTHSRSLSFLGLFLYFSIPWLTKYELFYFWLPDALASFFTVLALYFIIQKDNFWLVVTLSLGVLAKESVIFVAPLLYTLKARQLIDLPLLKKTALTLLLPIILLIGIRIWIPAKNHDAAYVASLPEHLSQVQKGTAEYNVSYLLANVVPERIKQFSPILIYKFTIGTFGLILFVLMGIGIVKQPLLFLRLSPFMFLVYLQPFLAVNIQRLVVVAFPAVIWLAIEGIKALPVKVQSGRALFVLTLLLFLPNLLIYRRFEPGIEKYVLLFQILLLIIYSLIAVWTHYTLSLNLRKRL